MSRMLPKSPSFNLFRTLLLAWNKLAYLCHLLRAWPLSSASCMVTIIIHAIRCHILSYPQYQDLLLCKSAANLSMDEVAALLKLLLKSLLHYTSPKTYKLDNAIPFDSIIMWTKVLCSTHFASLVVESATAKQALEHIALIRQVLNTHESSMQETAMLPSQLKFVLAADNNRPKVPKNAKKVTYSVQTVRL